MSRFIYDGEDAINLERVFRIEVGCREGLIFISFFYKTEQNCETLASETDTSLYEEFKVMFYMYLTRDKNHIDLKQLSDYVNKNKEKIRSLYLKEKK